MYFEMLSWLMDNEEELCQVLVKEEGPRRPKERCTSTGLR